MAGATEPLSLFPQGRRVAQWQVIDDYSYLHGAHELKFGINFRRNDWADLAYGPQTSGLMTFASMTDFVNGTLVNGSTYAQNFTRIGAQHIGVYSMGIYGQDQWKISSKLTLSLGLRLERTQDPSCAQSCFVGLASTFENLDHSATTPYNAAIQLGMDHAFRNLDSIVPQPRFGVAYLLTSKTVLRGGLGLFSDMVAGALNSRFFTNVPNVVSFTTAQGSGLIAAPGVPNSAFSNVAASNAAFQAGFANGATLATMKATVPGSSRCRTSIPKPTIFTCPDTRSGMSRSSKN
jgi:hypothetical protein